MKTRERVELEKMLEWVIRKMFENHPDISFHWFDLRNAASNAWHEMTDENNKAKEQ